MAVFCSSLMSCFAGTFLRYFLTDFKIVRVFCIITGINFVFKFHTQHIYIVKSLYLKKNSASFFIIFLYPEISMSINKHVPFSISRIITSGLFIWEGFVDLH
jgi:phage shock protein PspC (stress-responsive transcriptional regulator)